MKSTILLFISLCFTVMLQAQVSKTVNVTAGNLKTVLTADELKTVTDLTLTGTLNESDFYTMRDFMPALAVLDISGVSVNGNKIPPNSFSGKATLIKVLLPLSVTSIRYGAFGGCTSLTSVSIPSSLTYIGDAAFQGCSGLTSVSIPSLVTYIGVAAFQGCTGLTSVSIPSSVIYIRDGAFRNCSGSLTVDPNNPNYSSNDGVLYDKSQTSLIQCPTSKTGSVIIPMSVTTIRYMAFYGCTGLTSVTIPSSVTYIGGDAFWDCSVSFIVDFNNPNYSSNDGVLYDKGQTSLIQCPASKTGSFIIPSSVTSIRYMAFYGCTGLTSVTIPSSVISIGGGAFQNCAGLTSVTIPSSVTSIGVEAFSGCNGLTSVTIPSSVISIGGGAFYGCTGLTSVTILSSFTSIGDGAFYGCTGLTSVTILSSVNSIGILAFYLCSGLTSICIPSSVTSIGNSAFSNCTSLTSISIPSSVASIGEYAFNGCSGLASISIPSSVTSIGKYAFNGCSGLTSVSIPSSVTSIGEYAFNGCSGLTSVSIPSSVTSIGVGAFSNFSGSFTVDFNNPNYSSYDGVLYDKGQKRLIQCPTSKTGSFIIPSSVTSVGDWAFYGCAGLTSVTIPSFVTSIGEYAFSGCTGLTTIVSNSIYPIALSSSSVFDWIDKFNCTLYVPYGSMELYAVADQWKDFGNIVIPFIELSAFEINIAFNQGSQATLNIVSDVNWTVTCDQPWLTLSQTSGKDDATLVFTAEANPTASPRTAIVTVSAVGVNQQTIAITQEGGPTALHDLAENSTQLKCCPNPFNSATTINWQLAKTSHVTLKVLDITGRTVATLVDEQRPNGKYESQFNAGTLPKGIYFCQLKAGEFSQTRKMILME